MSLRIIDARKADGRAELAKLRQRLHSVAGEGRYRDPARKKKWDRWDKEVHDIIQDVAESGDRAVVKYTKKFDKLELTADTLRVSDEELEAAKDKADPRFMEAMRRAIENVRSYQKSWPYLSPAYGKIKVFNWVYFGKPSNGWGSMRRAARRCIRLA